MNARTVTGFMCKIDWDHEIGNASRGTRVYPSINAIRAQHTCADECGIVEVEVRLARVISEGTDVWLDFPKTTDGDAA